MIGIINRLGPTNGTLITFIMSWCRDRKQLFSTAVRGQLLQMTSRALWWRIRS
jgi:hypothetical protein